MGNREFPVDVYGWNNAMKNMKGRWGSSMSLRGLYDDMVQIYGIRPNKATFHIVIPSSARRGDIQDAVYFMKEMKSSGLKPDTVIYNVLIESVTKRGDINKAFTLAREMQSFGCNPNIRTLSLLMQACSDMGSYVEAESIMNSLPEFGLKPDVNCYSSLMTAYGKSGLTNAAEKIMEVVKLAKQHVSSTDEEDFVAKNRFGGINSSE